MLPKRKKSRRKYASSNAMYYLNKRQLELLISAGKNERDRLILQTFVETGVRRSELSQLLVQDIDPQNGYLNVRIGKGKKSRIIPLTRVLLKKLMDFLRDRVSGPLFVSRNGGTVSLRQLNRIVAEAGRRAKIHNPNPKQTNITCHLLRHSFARLWKEQGGNIEILSLLLGHSSVKTTYDSYARFGITDIRKQYQQLIEKGEKL